MNKHMYVVAGWIDNGATYERVKVIVESETGEEAFKIAKAFVEDKLHGDEVVILQNVEVIKPNLDGVLYYSRR